MTDVPEETPLRILFLGTPAAAVPSLRALREAGHEVPLVVTRPDRRKGRGKSLAASPVKEAALELGLTVFQPENVNAAESVDRLRAAEPDVLVIVAYGKILKSRVLEVPRLVPLNVHFSLLPAYRGASPVARAIAMGETRTGVSVQHVVKKLDAGPVYGTAETEILPGEKTGALEARLAEVGADLLVRTLDAIRRGAAEAVPQDHDRATFAPLLAKADGRIDWTRPAVEIVRHVRAMDPWPGATCGFAGARKGTPVTITGAAVGEEPADAPPGTVVAADKRGILVATGDGTLRIETLKPAGKRELTAAEFANGYRPQPGDRFDS